MNERTAMRRIFKTQWFILMMVFCQSCGLPSDTSDKLSERLELICLNLKTTLTNELKTELPDEFVNAAKAGSVGTLATKLSNEFLYNYPKGEDYFCFSNLIGNNGEVAGNLSIGFRIINHEEVWIKCNDPNICFSDDDRHYRILLAIIGGDNRENRQRWLAAVE